MVQAQGFVLEVGPALVHFTQETVLFLGGESGLDCGSHSLSLSFSSVGVSALKITSWMSSMARETFYFGRFDPKHHSVTTLLHGVFNSHVDDFKRKG